MRTAIYGAAVLVAAAFATPLSAQSSADERLGELRETLPQDRAGRTEEELGDLLFSLVNFCRFLGADAEQALRRANTKFETRFRRLEQRVRDLGRDPSECSLEALEEHWQAAKREVG